jgi:hypothetical protein
MRGNGARRSPVSLASLQAFLKIFEEVCGQDLSQFRIAPDRIKSGEDSKMRGHWQTQYAANTFVERAYFCSQVRGLMGYVRTAMGDA